MDFDQIKYIDSHAHMDTYSAQVLSEVLLRMLQARVGVVSIGTCSQDWQKLRELNNNYPQQILGYTAGIHPSEVKQNYRAEVESLNKFLNEVASHERPIGIGECGLDYYRLEESSSSLGVPKEEIVKWQRFAFQAQLQIIKSIQGPVVIHSRGVGAYDDIIKLIDDSGNDWRRFVFHCYSEGAKEIKELNARGGRGSFTGIITFKNASQMCEALMAQPIELTMVETDAPFLAPQPHRGKTNEPAWVPLVASKVAQLKGMSVQEVEEILLKNTVEFYNLTNKNPSHQ